MNDRGRGAPMEHQNRRTWTDMERALEAKRIVDRILAREAAFKVDNRFHSAWAGVRARATKAGIDYLTASEFVTLWRRNNGSCELTGIPFDFSAKSGNFHRNPHAPSVDRIQPGGDYRLSNCRLVLVCVNIALNEWGTKFFDQMCRAYVDKHGASEGQPA